MPDSNPTGWSDRPSRLASPGAANVLPAAHGGALFNGRELSPSLSTCVFSAVRFAMDRGGLVGADGATHCGAFDVTFMASLPNMVGGAFGLRGGQGARGALRGSLPGAPGDWTLVPIAAVLPPPPLAGAGGDGPLR